jgi:hypothetical protein
MTQSKTLLWDIFFTQLVTAMSYQTISCRPKFPDVENGEKCCNISENIYLIYYLLGARGGTVVEALRYKPEGLGIDSRWCHWNFSLI